jgi:hypothetical protein
VLSGLLLAACGGSPTSVPPPPPPPPSTPTPVLPTIAGDYEFHVVASAACADMLPGWMRDRRYAVRLTQTGAEWKGTTAGGSLDDLDMDGQVGHSSVTLDFGVFELPLMLQGIGTGVYTENGVAGTYSGYFCDIRTDGCPYTGCHAKDHHFELTRQ